MCTVPRSSRHGFTIVEIMVILVILAILTTITYASYTGIQTRSRQANAENSAKLLQKKLQAYFQVKSEYPTPSTATTDLNSLKASQLEGVVALGTPTTNNGQSTVLLAICTAGGTGYRITYWDYPANSLPGTPQITGGATVSSCTTWATAS